MLTWLFHLLRAVRRSLRGVCSSERAFKSIDTRFQDTYCQLTPLCCIIPSERASKYVSAVVLRNLEPRNRRFWKAAAYFLGKYFNSSSLRRTEKPRGTKNTHTHTHTLKANCFWAATKKQLQQLLLLYCPSCSSIIWPLVRRKKEVIKFLCEQEPGMFAY